MERYRPPPKLVRRKSLNDRSPDIAEPATRKGAKHRCVVQLCRGCRIEVAVCEIGTEGELLGNAALGSGAGLLYTLKVFGRPRFRFDRGQSRLQSGSVVVRRKPYIQDRGVIPT